MKSSAKKCIKNMLVCFPRWRGGGSLGTNFEKYFRTSLNKNLLRIVCARISIPLYAFVETKSYRALSMLVKYLTQTCFTDVNRNFNFSLCSIIEKLLSAEIYCSKIVILPSHWVRARRTHTPPGLTSPLCAVGVLFGHGHWGGR